MLAKEIRERCEKVFSSFAKISEDWKKYEDEIIPQDDAFAKDILGVLLDLISEAKSLDGDAVDFLSQFWYHFLYGPNGDDYNYLNFDEGSVVDEMLMVDWDSLKKEDLDALEKSVNDILLSFK